MNIKCFKCFFDIYNLKSCFLVCILSKGKSKNDYLLEFFNKLVFKMFY